MNSIHERNRILQVCESRADVWTDYGLWWGFATDYDRNCYHCIVVLLKLIISLNETWVSKLNMCVVCRQSMYIYKQRFINPLVEVREFIWNEMCKDSLHWLVSFVDKLKNMVFIVESQI
jgi:hypothetical protein